MSLFNYVVSAAAANNTLDSGKFEFWCGDLRCDRNTSAKELAKQATHDLEWARDYCRKMSESLYANNCSFSAFRANECRNLCEDALRMKQR